MKVIHLPTSVGGNAWGLSRGERGLGLESDVLYENTNWLEYPYDIVAPNSKSLFIKYAKRIIQYKNLLNKYDVFHFNFGKTLFDWYGKIDNLDLLFLDNKKK